MAVLQGLDQFDRALKQLSLVTQGQLLKQAVKKGAELIREEAENRAPRDTGTLAEEEIVSVVAGESNAFEATVKIGPSKKAFYGFFQEFGTAHHAAQPFLMPSFEEKQDEALQVVSDELRKAVEKIANL